MRNVALFYTSAMLPNIPSYCESLGYFLDANDECTSKAASKFHLSELSYSRFRFGLAHTANKSLLCELSSDS